MDGEAFLNDGGETKLQVGQAVQDVLNVFRQLTCSHEYHYRQRVMVDGQAVLIFECNRCGRLIGNKC